MAKKKKPDEKSAQPAPGNKAALWKLIYEQLYYHHESSERNDKSPLVLDLNEITDNTLRAQAYALLLEHFDIWEDAPSDAFVSIHIPEGKRGRVRDFLKQHNIPQTITDTPVFSLGTGMDEFAAKNRGKRKPVIELLPEDDAPAPASKPARPLPEPEAEPEPEPQPVAAQAPFGTFSSRIIKYSIRPDVLPLRKWLALLAAPMFDSPEQKRQFTKGKTAEQVIQDLLELQTAIEDLIHPYNHKGQPVLSQRLTYDALAAEFADKKPAERAPLFSAHVEALIGAIPDSLAIDTSVRARGVAVRVKGDFETQAVEKRRAAALSEVLTMLLDRDRPLGKLTNRDLLIEEKEIPAQLEPVFQELKTRQASLSV